MQRFHRILAAIDLADDHHLVSKVGLRRRCADALAKASWIATQTGADLRLVHVLPLGARARDLLERHDESRLIDDATRSLQGLVDGAKEHGIHATYGLRVGKPDQEILAEREEWGADLIVMARSSRERVTGLLGSTAAKVFQNADVPVWVSRRGMHRGIDSVLAAVDLDEHSHGVLRLAADTARRLGATFHAVHVTQSDDEAQRRVRLDALRAWTTAHAADVRLGTLEVRTGRRDDVLVDAASEIPADVVFVGPSDTLPLLQWIGAHPTSPLLARLECSLVCARAVPDSPEWPGTRKEEDAVRSG